MKSRPSSQAAYVERVFLKVLQERGQRQQMFTSPSVYVTDLTPADWATMHETPALPKESNAKAVPPEFRERIVALARSGRSVSGAQRRLRSGRAPPSTAGLTRTA